MEDFAKRFDDFKSHAANYILFSDPFSCNMRDVSEEIKFELIELQENIDAKNSYRNNSLIDFYKGLSCVNYPTIRKHAQQMFSLFGSTYI